MSDELFIWAIGLMLFITLIIYGAGLMISMRSHHLGNMSPPIPPPLSLLNGNWPMIRVRLHRDLEFVVADKQKLRIIMSAIDVAYEQGKHDRKAKGNKA